MNSLVEEDYAEASSKLWKDTVLPEVKSVDLCLNVASCDALPILVTVGKDEDDIKAKHKQLLPIAWNEQFAGQCLFASIKSSDDLRAIKGLDKKQAEGIYLVEPDPYGFTGNVLLKFGEDSKKNKDRLAKSLASYRPARKNQNAHKSFAVQMGLRWHTETPVTDQQFVRATERIWGEKYEHQPPNKNRDEKKSDSGGAKSKSK